MGVLNVTPDSFSDGGRYAESDAAVAHGDALFEAGADIVDVGGESTRPGATPVPAAEEIDRVVPVIEALARRTACILSVDSSKPEVIAAALDAEQLKALVEGRPIEVRVRTPVIPPPPPREGKIEHEGGRAGGILPPPMPAPKPTS